MVTTKYAIDYEWGIAVLYTPEDDWESRFYYLATQCFGIRKSLGDATVLGKTYEEPADKWPDEYERLEHNGDVIIWNKAGEKIKSEWD